MPKHPSPQPLELEAAVAAGDLWARLQYPTLDAGDVYWLEFDPGTGRSSVLRARDGQVDRVTPAGIDVRSGVHEYGGGAYAVRNGVVVYSDGNDGRLHCVGRGALTPAGADVRYGDLVLADGAVFCVRERHEGSQVVNDLIRVRLDDGGIEIVAAGRDFFSFPTVRPDGTSIAWTAWDHPGMPFIGCELWCDGERVAGGPAESIFQPAWSPDGRLHYVSDHSGWWNLHRTGTQEPLGPVEAELGWPQWFLGLSSYAFLDDGRIAALVNREGRQRLMYLDPGGKWSDAGLPYAHVAWPYLRSDGARLAFVAATPGAAPELVLVDTSANEHHVIRSSLPRDWSWATTARVEPLDVASGGVRIGGFLHTPSQGADRPPALVVLAHGGPTDQTVGGLRIEVELLTSRGLVVADVDYSGSTGYGRAYRDRLAGRWGVVDVGDCIEVARTLTSAGLVDPSRIAVMGGSAGGYIALCAVAFSDVFTAAVSLYGISDLGLWDARTHKFESSYTGWLVGTLDEEVLAERSPAAAARFSGPVLLLQGEDDRVVTPEHATVVAAAARAAGVPVETLMLPGEGHGFRRPESVRAALSAIIDFLAEAVGERSAEA